jgi:hypothetical protein
MAAPLLNVVMLLAWAFNNSETEPKSLVNFARAMLIFLLIAAFTGGVAFLLYLWRNVAIIACLAATAIFASCEKEEDPTSGAGDEFTIPDDGKVPSTVIPDEIRALLETNMPIYSGKTPPDIKGEYLADSKILTGSNYLPDEIGKSYLDQYIAFTKGANGKIRYDAEERRFDLPVSDDTSDDVTVYLVGTGNQFTAWFIATEQTYEIYNKESTIISGLTFKYLQAGRSKA